MKRCYQDRLEGTAAQDRLQDEQGSRGQQASGVCNWDFNWVVLMLKNEALQERGASPRYPQLVLCSQARGVEKKMTPYPCINLSSLPSAHSSSWSFDAMSQAL